MPTAGHPPPPCSSPPSQGTIHIPDVLDVLMQPIRRDKQYIEWDGEAFPIPDEMIIRNWDLPQGYTRESWADWEPENPFIVDRHYDHDPLAPNEGYEQEEMEGIFGRMAERKMAEEDEGHIVEAPSTDPATDLSVDEGIPESTTPRLITSTTEIHIANTLLSPSGGRLVSKKLSVPTRVSAKSGQPSKPSSYDSIASSRNQLVSSREASTQAEDPAAVDQAEKIVQVSDNDQLEEDAINEYIDLDSDSAEISVTVEDVSPRYSLSASTVSSTSTTNLSDREPISTIEEEPREYHATQSDTGPTSPISPAKERSPPTTALNDSHTHTPHATQQTLLPALEIETGTVSGLSPDNIHSPPTSSPSSPRSPHLVTPGTDTRASQGREEGIRVLEHPPQFSLTDGSDIETPQIVGPHIKLDTTIVEQHVVQIPSHPFVPAPWSSSPLPTDLKEPPQSPRDIRSSQNSSPTASSEKGQAVKVVIGNSPPLSSATDIDQSSIDLVPSDFPSEPIRVPKVSTLETDSPSGIPLPAKNDIDITLDDSSLPESDPFVDTAGTRNPEDTTHGVDSLAADQDTRKTTKSDTSSTPAQNMSKDDKMEVLRFIADQKRSDNSDGHENGPILIDIDSDSDINDEHQETPVPSVKDHEQSHEEQGVIEEDVPESPMTINELKKGHAEEEEGFDEDGEHESISESYDIELTSNTNVAEVIDDDMTQDHRSAETSLIEVDHQPESTITKTKSKPGRKPKTRPPPDPECTPSSDKRKYVRRATIVTASLRGRGSTGSSKIKRGPGRPPMKHLNGQNGNTLDADAGEEKPGKSRMLTTSKPTTMRMPSTSTSRGRSKTMFTRTQSTQTAIDRPKRGRKGKANALELENCVQDEETEDVDTPAPTELESKRLPSSSSPVQQPPVRRAAQNANAAFKTQDGDREVRPKIKPVQKRKLPLPPDPSKSDSDSFSERHTSKKVCKGETLKRWTLVEDACLLRCWDGKSVLSPAVISQACHALLDPAVESSGRTHEAVKYRLRQVYKNPVFHRRAKAFNEGKPSASA
ncbi:hypothetical protein L486_03550 [Kwoniella mangroviensis CBS 10435]|uniref:Uncharacterized protein n=1 Tax=Kwoniella mangroviensis CBS 10435 TaxID=1331196 RepID=A0A1B9IU42_9TREE|nr:hypothetical protein L486_03550 [Kwoniella mangroviensis CBS 10435]